MIMSCFDKLTNQLLPCSGWGVGPAGSGGVAICRRCFPWGRSWAHPACITQDIHVFCNLYIATLWYYKIMYIRCIFMSFLRTSTTQWKICLGGNVCQHLQTVADFVMNVCHSPHVDHVTVHTVIQFTDVFRRALHAFIAWLLSILLYTCTCGRGPNVTMPLALKCVYVLRCPNCILFILWLLLFPSLDSARHLPVSLFGGLCRNYICGEWEVKMLHLFSVAVTWIHIQWLPYLPAVMRLPAVIWS